MWKVCGGKFSLIFLISAQTVGYIYLMMTLQYNKPPPPETKPERVHILILSTWRSGSSFTGQIFSQHPDIFYLMEPTWHVWNTLPKYSVKVLQMAVRDVVRSIFSCDMSVFDAYMPQDRLKSTLFQWEASRALCTRPACKVFGRGDIVSQSDCQKLCKLYPFDTVESSCHTYSHVVIKEVRFFSLKSLYSLFKDPSLNFKVLHLVRDPRAIFQSRERAASELQYDNNIIMKDFSGNKSSAEDLPYRLMETICKSQADIYLAATNGNHSALDGRYMMVRYEDIVQDPIEKTRQMYEFANLTFTLKLQHWIHNLTHGSGRGSKFVINARDAVNVSKAWRKSLPFESVQRIQGVCSGAMEVFGYKTVKSKEAQSDLDHKLLLPIRERVKTSKKTSNI